MLFKIIKIVLILTSFIFTTGFLPIMGLIGPGFTILSTGNVYKAGFQIIIDQQVKNKTGKNSLAYVKDEVEKKQNEMQFNEDLKNLVEKRIKIAHEKFTKQSEINKLNKDFRIIVQKRVNLVRKKLDTVKIN